MKDYLLEIIFEDIKKENISKLIRELSNLGGEIVNSYNTKDIPTNGSLVDSIQRLLETDDFGLFINLRKISLKNADLNNPGLVIYKKNDRVDFELNFQASDVTISDDIDLIEQLMNFSKNLATKYGIASYFCGIEPAKDINTRLFTNEKRASKRIQLP